MNGPIVFGRQKSLKIQIFSLVQKVDLILKCKIICGQSSNILFFLRFNAPGWKIHILPGTENHIDLLIGSSHAGGIIGQAKKVPLSYLCYPGFAISCEEHWTLIKEDINLISKTYKVVNLTIAFGTNDASRASNVLFPDSILFKKLKQSIVYGNNTLVNPTNIISDPLCIIQDYPPDVVDHYTTYFDLFFDRLKRMDDILLPQKLTLLLFPGRYLKGEDSEEHTLYNLAAYYLRYLLHEKYSSLQRPGMVLNIFDNFIKEWCNGSSKLLPIHDRNERSRVVLQALHHPGYGAVHYNRDIYKQFIAALSP